MLAHELRTLALAGATYVAAGVFLLVMGFLYLWALRTTSEVASNHTPVNIYFALYFVPLFLVVPLLTMRAFSEEYRRGTLAALFSTPVRPFQVVLAKFTSAYLFYLLLWALALLFPIGAWHLLGNVNGDPRLLDAPALAGGFVFVAASGALYIAVGILASALTRSALIAAILAATALFVLLLLNVIVAAIPLNILGGDSFTLGETVRSISEYLDTRQHLGIYLRGIVDTRPLFLFASGTLLSLGLASLAVESKV
jgi:ABC-2 type transport system permease protein